MQKLAALIMRGRVYAMLIAAVFGVISLLLPPLQPITTTLSGGVVALVALRLGAREAAYVMFGTLAGVMAVAVVLFGSPAPAVVLAAVVWLPAGVLALVLRHTVSMALALQLAVLLAGVLVLGLHGVISDPAAWWRDMLTSMIQQSQLDKTGLEQMGQILQNVAPYMTGIVASALMLSALLSMVVGRWWQSLLYNPGGFGAEFRALQLGNRVAYPGVVVLAASLSGQFASGGVLAAIATDLLVVLVLIYALQGLAVAHAIAFAVERSMRWLVWGLMLVYVLLAILPPFVVVALAGIGFTDHWMNFRAYFDAKKPNVPPDVPGNP